ncbi:lipocalin family protein [Flavivirga amylovorans]|uniref:Lipocalin family protein n=1 Tax=Flavivirga amylovorans TaxID=870486 RepID=A0ABT8X5W4_9FLAO|nr:lipocalin family protein [Flavivirga amylovorans]MDO5989386.1 lipocalin family protein [Flavivirga amylovorans]
MKNTFIFLIIISLMSCGTSKTVRVSKKVIKGDWSLSSISYDKPGTYKIKLLSDVSKECFEGSTWKFVSNNNTGIYAINNGNCETGDRYFNFTVQEVDAETGLYHFLLKPTDIKGKSETNRGFRIELSELSNTDMQWQQTVSVDGEPFTINMNFVKLQ